MYYNIDKIVQLSVKVYTLCMTCMTIGYIVLKIYKYTIYGLDCETFLVSWVSMQDKYNFIFHDDVWKIIFGH